MKSYSIVFSFSLLCNGIEYYGWIIYQAAVSSRTLELKKLCTNQNSHMYESKETLWVLKKCKCRIRKGELCLFAWWSYKSASLTNGFVPTVRSLKAICYTITAKSEFIIRLLAFTKIEANIERSTVSMRKMKK